MKDFALVFIVVLNWNSYEETITCINSCRELTYSNFRILLIDNDSTDGSGLRLRKHFTDIEFIQTGANLGYAKGNNLGIKYAVKNNAEFIWILNPDVIVEKPSLSILVDVMIKNSAIGICGPRIIDRNLRKGFCFDGLNIFPDNGYLTEYNVLEDQPNKMIQKLLDVDCVSGCSMLVRSKLFHDIGLLREDFFLYYDDTEFNFRARKCGWRTVVCRQSKIIHISKNPLVRFYVERNKIVFARIQKKYVLKTAIKLLFIDQLKNYFKEGSFIVGSKILLHSLLRILSGLLTPIKPIPRI